MSLSFPTHLCNSAFQIVFEEKNNLVFTCLSGKLSWSFGKGSGNVRVIRRCSLLAGLAAWEGTVIGCLAEHTHVPDSGGGLGYLLPAPDSGVLLMCLLGGRGQWLAYLGPRRPLPAARMGDLP